VMREVVKKKVLKLLKARVILTTWFILTFSPCSQACVTQSLILPCHSLPLGYKIYGGSLPRGTYVALCIL
jgi:hypothetical protein